MRRKISLLLAFAMVLSILPMNVFASGPAITGGGTRTGMLAEPAGPARNVRHFNDGVIVGREIATRSPYTPAPQGNLRTIFADAAYFAGRTETRAVVTMNIHNVRGWLHWPGPLTSPPGQVPPPAMSVYTTLSNNTSGGVRPFSTTSPSPTLPVPDVNWNNPSQMFAGNTHVDSAALTNFNNFVERTINATEDKMAPASLIEILNAVSFLGATSLEIQASFINEFFTGWNSPSLTALSIRTAPINSVNAPASTGVIGMNLPPGYPVFAAGIVTQTQTSAQLRVWRPFSTSVPNGLVNWRGSSDPMTADQQSAALAFVTSTDNWVQLPIEFVTNGDTNDNPVYLTFFENSGWPQAGQVRPGAGVPGRTDLTAVTDNRFTFGVGGVSSLRRDNTESIRSFHRYQRGVLPAIRIAEGAQGAFDQTNWWIELEIQQTGFFFSPDSVNDVRFTTRWGGGAPLLPNGAWAIANPPGLPLQADGLTMGGNGIATGGTGWRARQNDPLRVASELAMLTLSDGDGGTMTARREPTSGPNQYKTLVFGLSLPGVGLPGRTVNDWIDIHHLSILADDRAREGDVDIKVTLYRATPVSAAAGTTSPGFVGTLTPPSNMGWGWIPLTTTALPAGPSGGFWGWYPGISIGSSGSLSQLNATNLLAAQNRNDSVFMYTTTPRRFEQFNPNITEHVANANTFNLIPVLSVVTPTTPDTFFVSSARWNGVPQITASGRDIFMAPTATQLNDARTAGNLDGSAANGNGLTISLAERANFWREVGTSSTTASNTIPRYRVFGAAVQPTASTNPSSNDVQDAFDADVISPPPASLETALEGTNGLPATSSVPGGQLVNSALPTNLNTWENFTASRSWQLFGQYTNQTQSQTVVLTPIAATANTFTKGGSVDDGTVTVARFGALGLEFVIHDDHSAEDHWLQSGRRDWDFNRERPIDGRRPIGAVTAMIDDTHHLTARAVLRELSAGALAATGGNPVTFEFEEGIQILGAKIWTNDANFTAFNDTDRTVWFNGREDIAANILGAVIERNTLTIRPEIGNSLGSLPAPSRVEQRDPRWRAAEIGVQFYLSVMPGFVHTFQKEEIEVTVVTSDASEAGGMFTETRTIAFVEDPIEIDTSVATVGAIDPAEFGSLHVIPINDITVTEAASRNLEVGTRLWIGVEGGISRGFGAADHISLTAGSVDIVGGGTLEVGPLRSDTHGAYVEILRPSNANGAQIIFRDVKLSGRVFSEAEYNIIVAGNAVAGNWEEYLWLDSDMPSGIARGGIHGFFHEEPYPTPAFVFAGEDVGITELPAPAPAAPAPAPAPAPATREPVILTQNIAFVRPNGDVINPPFEMVPIPGTDSATAFISVRAIGDILGWELVWASPTATFTLPNGDELVFTLNESTASLNGTSMPMMNALGTPVAARNTNDRLMVPIRFFRDLGVNVQWLGGSTGRFMISVAHGSLTP